MTIVGLGASAGGLAALKTLFTAMPQDSGMAFVVVVHLSPDRESHLADLLQPHTSMPVRQVAQTVALEPNAIYVIPPGANLDSIDTHLRLTKLEEKRRERAPIDHFFRTLAATHDGHSIGVVLTGTGSDGTQGLRSIKEKGGVTIAQSTEDAEFDGMPRSAIASGEVDIILPLAEIPAELVRIAGTEPRVKVDVSKDEEPLEEQNRLLQKIFAQVRARTGHDFNSYKRSTIMRRIARRMQLRHETELSDYLALLREDRDEVIHLFEDLLINVTKFFRDDHVYETLAEKVVPAIFENKKRDDRVRVWSVGCSTGEEAYSLAMLILEEADRYEDRPSIQIFASDMHENSLSRAREGLYPDSIAADVSPERLERFFVSEGGSYRIRKEVREHVVFAPHNLLSDPPFSHLDLVVCRNVLIYLQKSAQEDVIGLFHYALEPEGWMVLGTAETVESNELFHCVDKSAIVYRRRNVPPREPPISMFPLSVPRGRKEVPQVERRDPASFGAMHAKMVEQYAPPSVLVSPNHDIVHYSANAGRFLEMPGGLPTNNVFRLVREPLRVELRAALHAAHSSGASSRSRPVELTTSDGVVHVIVRVSAAPGGDMEGFFLVIFDEVAEASSASSQADGSLAPEAASELADELAKNKQRLQAILEEYETSQEEMQASNEELQSANEELRSTLEELETSKEELQSMNEELATVNQENRHRVEELSLLSGDLQNLMASTDIATLFLDRELKIVRFTPRVGELFNVRQSDRGRPLGDLTHRLVDADLHDSARQVLARLSPIEREVKSEAGLWFLTRVVPYRTSDDRIMGVVITLVDITRRKLAEESLMRARDELERRVEERTARLNATSEQLRRLAHELAAAEHRERKRIAGILHDDLQQILVGAKLQLFAVRKGISATASSKLESAIRSLDEALGVSTNLTRQLRPPALYEDGLVSAFRWLGADLKQRHGLDVEIASEEVEPPLGDDIKAMLFESIRELLFNVVKHSGQKHARVELNQQGSELRIEVSDDGIGFDPEALEQAGGQGLFSLRERLTALGGQMTFEPNRAKGTEVILAVPLGDAGRRPATNPPG